MDSRTPLCDNEIDKETFLNKKSTSLNYILLSIIIIFEVYLSIKILLCIGNIILPDILKKILTMILDILSFSTVLFVPLIVSVVPKIYEDITGRKWYTEKADIQPLDKYKTPLTTDEKTIIKNLIENTETRNFHNKNAKNKYFDIVFQLQKENLDFNLYWNNFNYYLPDKNVVLHEYWENIVYKSILEYYEKTSVKR
jgi:hypothetical protein